MKILSHWAHVTCSIETAIDRWNTSLASLYYVLLFHFIHLNHYSIRILLVALSERLESALPNFSWILVNCAWSLHKMLSGFWFLSSQRFSSLWAHWPKEFLTVGLNSSWQLINIGQIRVLNHNRSLLRCTLLSLVRLQPGGPLLFFFQLLHILLNSLFERRLNCFRLRYESLLGILLSLDSFSVLIMNILQVIVFAWSWSKRAIRGSVKSSWVHCSFIVEIAHCVIQLVLGALSEAIVILIIVMISDEVAAGEYSLIRFT